MKSIKTTCPECAHVFALDEVLIKEIDSMVLKGTEEIVEKTNRELRTMKRKMEEAESENRTKVQEAIKEAVSKALRDQAVRISEENEIVSQAHENELIAMKERLLETQRNEIMLRKKVAEVEQKESEIDLVIERRTSEQVNQAKEILTRQIAEDFHRKDLEREQLVSELRKQLIELKNRAEQGSQQAKGEIFEQEIAEILKLNFPADQLENVSQGVRGGDLVHTVFAKSGQRAGRILWEIKQTKNFQTSWIDKLREDRNEIGADMAILLTASMPKGKTGAYLEQGVWVVNVDTYLIMAQIARQTLIDVHHVVISSSARHEKADILYSYLTNPVFRQRLEAIVESFHQMRDDLEREKRAISKSWKQRERQLDSLVENTVQIYADIQSVVGNNVLSIQRLELPG